MENDYNNFRRLPHNSKLLELAKKLRNAGNLSEVLLWNELKAKRLSGLSFRRQSVVGNYIVDFFCAGKMVVVEIDGESHERGDRPEKDEIRNAYLTSLGLNVIHISDIEVKQNLEGVVEFLKSHPALRAPLHGGEF